MPGRCCRPVPRRSLGSSGRAGGGSRRVGRTSAGRARTSAKENHIASPSRGRQQQGPQTRVNTQIRAKTVRVISSDNEQLGILDIEEALRQADEQGLDL
ncbi:MAG TPA: hypothetical protein VKA48_04805, partial [Gammaproteobacteria bacterium]|nr:hypothetical protein [Gammaproteobacteria bacterium]